MRTAWSLHSFRLRFVALAALAALLVACGPEDAASPQVAATVNGDEVAMSEVRERFDAVSELPEVAARLEEGDVNEIDLQAEILTGLIRSRLLSQGAEELGVEVTDDDIDATREEIIEQIGGEEAFEQEIERLNLTEETLRFQLRDLALQDAVAEELTADAEVDEDELQALYDQRYLGDATASARHILVETEEEAQAVLQRLEAGEDFTELAREVSTDSSVEQNDGLFENFARGDMVTEFSDAVFEAEEGETVGPVETEFGFHVIEVLSIEEGEEGPPMSEVEEELRAELQQGASATVVQEWLNELSQEADVTVNPRFGEWDATTGRVVPADPLGDDGEGDGERPGQPGTSPADPDEDELDS